jgi:hypothetical protein
MSTGPRPLQTISKLKKFRDALALGKPEHLSESRLVDEPPDVWEDLQTQWEACVSRAFVVECREDEAKFWALLLKESGIQQYETIGSGGQSLSAVVDK